MMTNQHQIAPASRIKCWHEKLRGELLFAIALKLVLLLVIKVAFFPQRLPSEAAAQGVADHFASQSSPSSETITKVTKDKP
jgi:hypothetical protein